MQHEYPNKMLRRPDLLYPDLSYKIIGAAFTVYNELGWGHREAVYQRAFAKTLDELGIAFTREHPVTTSYHGVIVGRAFLDFIVEGKVVVELKVIPKMGYVHINQVVAYLTGTHLPLAILIYFLKDGVRYRRIIRRGEENGN